MTPHELMFATLGDLAEGRVYPSVADEGTATPYVTFQIVGGAPINFLTGEKPTKRFVRVQVNVWAKGSIEAAELAAQVEDAVRAKVELQPEILTGPIDTYDASTKYRGTMQDFTIFC